jgi:transposase
MNPDTSIEVFANKCFANTAKGFADLMDWVAKMMSDNTKVMFVMEATGIYHEAFAYYLFDKEQQVSIVLPNKISSYARTLNVKTVTDKSASQAIARFGLERQLECWQPQQKIFRELKQLTRERDQLIVERTSLKNQLHAEQSEAYPNQRSILRINERINLITKQEQDIRSEIAEMVKQDAAVYNRVQLLTSVPGIGKLTAVIILAETNGFELIRNKKQLVSYAGLDVKEKTSGISVKGKPRISKRGNRHVRKAMHLPALAAIRTDERFKSIFARLIAKHGIKMKAAVAIQRKILELTFTVWKNNIAYDKDYLKTALSNQGD